ncbi:MAG: hypothetical protein EOP85_22055 [Verrucomicrobiaceae bacterium]|nr:MAG: hypothetical protein EOP85_22055 [Verrucomicrobiaceae bacterium]
MFLRFQTIQPDPGSGRPTGILVAAHALRDGNRISMEDEKWLREKLLFFNTHLKIPACLKEPENRKALSWFRQESKMIPKVWDVKALLEEYDIFIDVVSTRTPGNVIYQDGHQIVAIPSRGVVLHR